MTLPSRIEIATYRDADLHSASSVAASCTFGLSNSYAEVQGRKEAASSTLDSDQLLRLITTNPPAFTGPQNSSCCGDPSLRLDTHSWRAADLKIQPTRRIDHYTSSESALGSESLPALTKASFRKSLLSQGLFHWRLSLKFFGPRLFVFWEVFCSTHGF